MARKYTQKFGVVIQRTNAMQYAWKQAVRIEASRKM